MVQYILLKQQQWCAAEYYYRISRYLGQGNQICRKLHSFRTDRNAHKYGQVEVQNFSSSFINDSNWYQIYLWITLLSRKMDIEIYDNQQLYIYIYTVVDIYSHLRSRFCCYGVQPYNRPSFSIHFQNVIGSNQQNLTGYLTFFLVELLSEQ